MIGLRSLKMAWDGFAGEHTSCEIPKKVLEFYLSIRYLRIAIMKTALRIILPLVLTFLLVGLLFASSVLKDRSLGASSKNGNVSVVWQTVSETNVVMFEVWRAPISPQGAIQDFTFAGSVSPHGVGREYEFIDQAPFKVATNLFAYKVRVVFQDGTSAESEIVRTAALSSTAKRTWGSIKAMFR